MTLADGAKNTIFTCLAVRKGEKVLILTDPEKKKIGEALFNAAVDAGAETIMVKIMPSTRDGEEPPRAIANLMREFEVIVIATKYSMSHTLARKKATLAGARIATLPGITETIFGEGGMTADFNEISKTIKRIYKTLKGKRKLNLTTSLGTDIELSVKGREWITGDTGICHERGFFTTLPAGELFIAPNEGKSQGTLMIDGSLGYMVPEEPVKVVVKNGYAVEFIGGEEIAKELDKRGKEGRNLAEFGMGMNPTAKIVGQAIEDEKVLGTVHIAFGDNSTFGGKIECGVHIDAIIKEPTVEADSVLIMEKGVLKV